MKNYTATAIIAAVCSLSTTNALADFREIHALQATIDTTQTVEVIYSNLRSSAHTACKKMTSSGRDHSRNVRICSKEVLAEWIDNSGLDPLAIYHHEQNQSLEPEFQIASEN